MYKQTIEDIYKIVIDNDIEKQVKRKSYDDSIVIDYYDFLDISYKQGKGKFKIRLFNLVCKSTLTDYRKVMSMLEDDLNKIEKAEKLHSIYDRMTATVKKFYSYEKESSNKSDTLAGYTEILNRLKALNDELVNRFSCADLTIEKKIKLKKAVAYKLVSGNKLEIDYKAKSFEKFGYTWFISSDSKIKGLKHVIVPCCGLPCASVNGSFNAAIESIDEVLLEKVLKALENYDSTDFMQVLKDNNIDSLPVFKIADSIEVVNNTVNESCNISIDRFSKKMHFAYDLIYNTEIQNPAFSTRELVKTFDDRIDDFTDILKTLADYRKDFISSDRESAAFIMTIMFYAKEGIKTIDNMSIPAIA